MLKFRVTNSVKARRAAEAQKKALEEKLQLEWAWKPMAAMMNETQTDLVYWIPPLYSSNLVAAGVHSRRPSLSTRPHASSSQRKKKLARRRAKLLSSDDSYEDVKDTDTLVDVNELKDDDNESGIHDDAFDTSTDDTSTFTTRSIAEEDEYRQMDDDSTLENSSIVTTIPEDSSKASEEKSPRIVVERTKKAPSKASTRPTILKLLDKVSHLHGITGNPLGCRAKKAKEPRPNDSTKKARRPSVKVYHNPPKARLSNRRSKTGQNDPNGDEPCIIVSLDPNAAPAKIPTAAAEILVEAQPGRKESVDPEAVRHAQLQMILRLLAQLYEEKVSRQDTEIQTLKMKLQTQDKLMRQMAQLVLSLKDDVAKLKSHSSVGVVTRESKPNNVLSIKVGDTISC